MNMDLSKVFRALCYVVMVLGGLVLLIAILTVVGVGAATSGADSVTRGGFTFTGSPFADQQHPLRRRHFYELCFARDLRRLLLSRTYRELLISG